MKTQTDVEVAESCLEYRLTFGIPEAVLTDQGSNFTSQVIESMWERLDVHTLRTTAYHPQTDGITEISIERSRQCSPNSSMTKSKTIEILN